LQRRLLARLRKPSERQARSRLDVREVGEPDDE